MIVEYYLGLRSNWICILLYTLLCDLFDIQVFTERIDFDVDYDILYFHGCVVWSEGIVYRTRTRCESYCLFLLLF